MQSTGGGAYPGLGADIDNTALEARQPREGVAYGAPTLILDATCHRSGHLTSFRTAPMKSEPGLSIRRKRASSVVEQIWSRLRRME